ncbi:MAG: hypothetical protein JWM16_3649 [Verrucomicrobiales bacterium]|nr:hypothetical protein [Verrucomicrobiales bacterium]
MNIRKFSPTRSEDGSVLALVMVSAGLVGLVLVAYLSLAKTQHSYNARTETWHSALPIAEAGVEEALTHLNDTANTNLTDNGWSYSGGVYTRQRSIGGGSYGVRFTISNLTATIVSTGYLAAPVTVASSGGAFLAAAGAGVSATNYTTRTVRVVAQKSPTIIKAMLAKLDIGLGGNSCTVDSYDSSKGAYGGSNIGDKGDVATDSDMKGAVSVGNAKIKGKLSVGPTATVDLGPNAIVGSLGWHSGGNKGIQSGWLKKDMNAYIPDVPSPWSGGALPLVIGSGGGVVGSGNYEVWGNLTLGGSGTLHINGDAKIWVKGNLNINGEIKINPPAHLTMYVDGDMSLHGDWNNKGSPGDMYLFGMPTCKKVDVWTGADFEAVVYAPSADLVLKGNAEFYGASVTKTVSMNGTTAYHYDEALGTSSASRGYVVISWEEL